VSDQELGKKIVEEIELQPFLDEYRAITGRTLNVLGRSERPDFICVRGSGPRLGLELVRVMEDPGIHQSREILHGVTEADPVDTAVRLQEAVYNKEAKRASPGWQYPKRTILVLQVMDAPVESVAYHLDDELMDEMSATGFLEIWAADYTIMEPHGAVQLLGIKPKRWRGIYPHGFYGQKPFG